MGDQYTPQQGGYSPLKVQKPAQPTWARILSTLRWWWTECLAILISSLSFIGIVILTNNGQPRPSICVTGNCSWPLTPSIAICGGCVETTFSMSCNDSKTANLTNLGENDGVGVAFQVFPSPGSYFDRSKTDKLYLSNFEAVKMPAGTQFMDQSWQKKAEKAYECALWACMHAIETWQVNSNQTQTARYTWDKVDNSSTTPDVRDHNITFVDIPKYMNVPTNANFTFLGWPAMAMNAYFDTLFDGNITVMNSIQLGSSDVVQALWNATADLDTWMQIVASSMTNIVRSFDLAPEQPSFDGIAYQLGYDVRWIWIILPATIVGASLLLLVVVIVRTTRSDTHPWKGSPLALLLMSVDHNMAARAHGQMERYDGIEKAIGKERVTLGRDANGLWRLKQA